MILGSGSAIVLVVRFVKRYVLPVAGTLLALAILAAVLFPFFAKAKGGSHKGRRQPIMDPWVIEATDPIATEPALLWNGLIGIRIGRDGTGLDADGKPLPFFEINEYDTKGEEKIRTLPNPLSTTITIDHQKLDPRQATDYSQRLNLKDGTLLTSWHQAVGSKVVDIQSKTILSPDSFTIGQQWRFVSSSGMDIELENAFGKECDEDGGFQTLRVNKQWIAVSTNWYEGDSISANASKPVAMPPFKVVGKVGPSQTATIELCFDLDRIGGPPQIMNARGQNAGDRWAVMPTKRTFENISEDAAKTWQKRWLTDIEIDGPVEDQQAVRSFLFYLRSAISPGDLMAISPFSLSNQQYNGHVFWDADIWVFPALALIAPDEAKAITQYRLDLAKQARANAAADQPPSPDALRYPWESSVTGKETVPGPSQKELHITGSVLWSANLAAQLGLAAPGIVDALGSQASNMYWSRSQPGKDGRELKDVMSPDENHTGDNDLYTNLLAGWLYNRYVKKAADPWKDIPYKLPHDDKGLLTYDNDLGRGYKQAAAVLSIYPLQYPPAEKAAKTMMDRYADKAIKNGPAMTDSINSIIWSRLGDKDKAYDAWRDSWKPFTTGPLLLFSEKRTRPATYFTTGAAGSLQSVLFGFLGIRIDYDKEAGAAWKTPLLNGTSWLSIKPNLPKPWKSVKFKNFTVLGRRYNLTVTPTTATVSPGE